MIRVLLVRLLQLTVFFGAGYTGVKCAYLLKIAPRELVVTVIRHDCEKAMLAALALMAVVAAAYRWLPGEPA